MVVVITLFAFTERFEGVKLTAEEEDELMNKWQKVLGPSNEVVVSKHKRETTERAYICAVVKHPSRNHIPIIESALVYIESLKERS